MDGTQITQITSLKHLGVNFNNTVSWYQHVGKVYTSCARRIGMIRRLQPVVLKLIYLGASLPKLDNACPVWCGIQTQKLIKMHANFCLRSGTALPSLQTEFDYHTLVMFYKIRTKQAPSYLSSLLPPLHSGPGYTFRKLSYRFPTVSKTSHLHSFLPRAIALWNALPTNVQQANSIFSNHILKHKPSTSLLWFFFVHFSCFFFPFFSFTFLFLFCLLCPILLIYRNAAWQVLVYFFWNPVYICLWSLKSENLCGYWFFLEFCGK